MSRFAPSGRGPWKQPPSKKHCPNFPLHVYFIAKLSVWICKYIRGTVFRKLAKLERTLATLYHRKWLAHKLATFAIKKKKNNLATFVPTKTGPVAGALLRNLDFHQFSLRNSFGEFIYRSKGGKTKALKEYFKEVNEHHLLSALSSCFIFISSSC